MSVADASHRSTPGDAPASEKPPAEQHPFPAAVSGGPAPPAVVRRLGRGFAYPGLSLVESG